MYQILVVEDNADYQELLVNFLSNAGFSVNAVGDGLLAIDAMEEREYDLVILDIMLPKLDGFTLCELIRKKNDVPIVMLTAKFSEEDQLKGYQLKVDEYISKTTSMPVIVSKVEAILRRSGRVTASETLSMNGIVLDEHTHTVTIDGGAVEFTLKEFDILSELMKANGGVVTRKTLLSKLWDYEYYEDTRIVDTHIKNIRRKLGNNDCIETVRGIGYKMTELIK
ncbi:MAG: response regulator transcription factor [Lachnospiraceae bacterium]|jgi:two-component system response regulator VanR|nr:response regulator transcription factor [Lachnospiraceae bacterium]